LCLGLFLSGGGDDQGESDTDCSLRGPHGEYFEGWGQILTDFVDSGFFGFVFWRDFESRLGRVMRLGGNLRTGFTAIHH
jgi:hypothetical protein